MSQQPVRAGSPRSRLIVSLSVVLSIAAGATQSAAGAGDARVILATGSPWRRFSTWRKPAVSIEALRAAGKRADAPAVLPVKVAWSSAQGIQHLETAAPPANWREADFDDADWPRSGGRFRTFLYDGQIALRGRFAVSDPATVKDLSLSMTYRGGVVVYLNGKEVARAHMPRGDITVDTPANSYRPEAFVNKAGKYLMTEQYAKGDERERVKRRNRSLGPVRVSAKWLCKGVNVLAVELHRAPFHPVALTWWNDRRLYAYGKPVHWIPIGLRSIRLTAAGKGIVPNMSRPKGMQVWPVDLHNRLDSIPFGDPVGGDRSVRITGVRNGTHSGALVFSSSKEIESPRCVVGDLVHEDGKSRIPRSCVQVRYVRPGDIGRSGAWRRQMAFDVLSERAPRTVPAAVRPHNARARVTAGLPATPQPGAVLPIWITITVPKDAVPGTYKGSILMSAQGVRQPFGLPLKLQVADWAVPDPRGFRTHVGVYQSPTTLSMHYKVPMWSEKHWKLIEQSLALLALLGNKLVNIPVVEQTQFGNDEGMIHWIKKDGGYEYDFTHFDRYMKLVDEHLGRQDFVALQIWHSGGWAARKPDQKNTVTVVDRKSGARTRMQVPTFGTAESKRFWKPLLDAVRGRLRKRKMDKAMCIGILSDGTAAPQVFGAFADIAPDLGWTRGCHSVTRAAAPYGLRGGGKVVYHEYCYGLGIPVPVKRIPKIHAQRGPGTAYFRSDFDNQPLVRFRLFAERGLYCGTRGIGRVCLDFWSMPIQAGRRTRTRNLYNRWPHSSCAQRAPTVYTLSQPGPDGPLPTLRFEMLREGIQTAEAATVISEALHDQAARLGPRLAATCKGVLVERMNTCRQVNGVGYSSHNGWRDRAGRLFTTAAQVTKKLKGRPAN